ncbi:LacI family DNA-binding transcriptional regulator [Marinactinospora rubrisoli]|uniref:LacI family DNA-binding transcriptional regulator n=1 Tax=Marinactinospora rubrisoli TaxID=2715399 RepID=A0ABW2KEK5_9ACTN
MAPEQSRRPRPRAAADRPTIHDVAAAAGVSRGTVSRVLNGGANVSAKARLAVQEAVRTTGYVPNPAARSLKTRRAGSVAFLLTEPQERLFEDPTFGVLLHGCTKALARHDLPLTLLTAGTPEERARARRYVEAGHADGVLLVSGRAGEPLVGAFHRSGTPLVLCGRPIGQASGIAYVAADDREGARQMVRHLRERGHRRIATITGPLDTPGGVDRLAGYRDVMGEAAAPELVAVGDYSGAGGAAAMESLLRSAPDLDAVFVASDLMAAGAIGALHRAGIKVPDDVAVGGFDDTTIAAGTSPPLTTVRQPLPRIAAEMVRLLMEIIDGSPGAAVILPTTLVRRGSA